jgi:hypothetical protein
MTSNDPHAIARRLTAAQRALLLDLAHRFVWALRPGSNLHPDLEAEHGGWSAQELDALHRAGIAHAWAESSPFHPIHLSDLGEVEMDHRWGLTDLGAMVRTIVEQEQGGGDE